MMRKKKYILFGLIAIMIAICSCGITHKKSENRKVDISTGGKYVVNEVSKIEDDLEMFGVDSTKIIDELALADISILFPGDQHKYVYFVMPCDTEDEKYRVKNITIGEKSYNTKLVDKKDSYQKYIIEELPDATEYSVTEVTYTNLVNKELQKLNASQLLKVKMEKDKYSFEQEHHYSVMLKGQIFESIYQFNKENNAFIDIWSNLIDNTETLDMDQRSFFYFAFNCYDTEKDIYFVPEDILELDVKYCRNSYQYEGKEKEKAENIKPISAQKEYKITQKEEAIYGKDEKRSEKKLYKYQRINKLSDADFTKNTDKTNQKLLEQVARQYDWAVAFGEANGYPYKKIESGYFFHAYDIDYTTIDDFKTIHVVYKYQGNTVDAKTSSLLKKETEVIEENKPEATKKDEREYTIQQIIDNEECWVVKILKLCWFFIEPLIPSILFILVVVLCIINRKRIMKKLSKIIKKLPKKIIKLKEWIEEILN